MGRHKEIIINGYTVTKKAKDNDDSRFECRNEFNTYKQYGYSKVLCEIIAGNELEYQMWRASTFKYYTNLNNTYFSELFDYCRDNIKEFEKWLLVSNLEVKKVFNILSTLVVNQDICLEQCYRFLERAIPLNNEIYLFLDFDFDNIGLDDDEIVFIDYGHAALGG